MAIRHRRPGILRFVCEAGGMSFVIALEVWSALWRVACYTWHGGFCQIIGSRRIAWLMLRWEYYTLYYFTPFTSYFTIAAKPQALGLKP